MIEVLDADLAALEADAIVNAANTHLVLGSGVAGAIRRAGGEAVQRECDEMVGRDGPLEPGQSRVTTGGELPAPYVIHAATMPPVPAEPLVVLAATRSALALAAEWGLAHVGMPALGTGVGGMAVERSARIMVPEVRAALRERDLEHVTLCLRGSEAVEAFRAYVR